MLFRKIRGMEFPAVGMGTSRTFDVDDSISEVFSVRNKIVKECQNNGVTLVDSSPMYGNAEKVLGLAIQENDPSKFEIATKVWTTGYQSGVDQIDNSFLLLKSKIDSFPHYINRVPLGSPQHKDGSTLSETLFRKKNQKIVFTLHKLVWNQVPLTFSKYGMEITFLEMDTPFATRKN